MNPQRIVGWLLITLAAALFGATGRTWIYPTSIALVALAGASGRWKLHLPSARRLIVVLLLAAIFAVVYRFAPYDRPGVNGIFYPAAHALGQYLLSVAALQFFLNHKTPRPGGLPPALPLLGIAVMVCAGDVYASPYEERLYRSASLSMAALIALFYATRRRPHPERRGTVNQITAGMVMAAVLLGGYWSANALVRYQQALRNAVEDLPLQYRPDQALGWDEDVELGSVPAVKTSDAQQVALRVLADAPPGYLRGAAYDRYLDRDWTSAASSRRLTPVQRTPDRPDPPPRDAALFLLREAETAAPHEMEIWPAPQIAMGMFCPADTVAVAAPVESLRITEDRVIDSDDLLTAMNYGLATVGDSDDHPPEPRHLDVPPDLRDLLERLAAEIFPPNATDTEKMQAVEKYFHEQYEYNLGISVPPEAEPVHYFLTERPAAHCEFFATGAALLLRSADIPARYVTGFVVRERSVTGEYWQARNRDAHAWVEAWSPRRGWVLVEATPASGVPGGDRPGLFAGLWGHLEFRFQQLRVMIYRDGFAGFLRWSGRRLLGLAIWLTTTPLGWLVTLLLIAYTAFRLRRQLGWLWCLRRRRQAPQRPLVVEMRRLLHVMDRRMARQKLRRHEHETLHQFAARLDSTADSDLLSQVSGWYRRYAAVRYGHRPGPADVQSLRESLPRVPR